MPLSAIKTIAVQHAQPMRKPGLHLSRHCCFLPDVTLAVAAPFFASERQGDGASSWWFQGADVMIALVVLALMPVERMWAAVTWAASSTSRKPENGVLQWRLGLTRPGGLSGVGSTAARQHLEWMVFSGCHADSESHQYRCKATEEVSLSPGGLGLPNTPVLWTSWRPQ